MGKREAKGKKYIEFSKICVATSFILVIAFIVFTCYEIHIQQNLDPISYIGSGILLCLAIIVRAYMKRAYQKDLAMIEIKKTEKLSQLKEKHGENFTYDPIEDVTLDS